jgi:hypothetical protein
VDILHPKKPQSTSGLNDPVGTRAVAALTVSEHEGTNMYPLLNEFRDTAAAPKLDIVRMRANGENIHFLTHLLPFLSNMSKIVG